MGCHGHSLYNLDLSDDAVAALNGIVAGVAA
jgi:hypothetical protein